MNFDQLNDSVERLIQNLEFIQSLEDDGIPMSDDHRDMILRNIDTIQIWLKKILKHNYYLTLDRKRQLISKDISCFLI